MNQLRLSKHDAPVSAVQDGGDRRLTGFGAFLTMAAFVAMTIMSAAAHARPAPDGFADLAAKLTALLAYVGFGSLALRRAASVRTRALSACLALLIFVYMLGAAHRHSVLSWLV